MKSNFFNKNLKDIALVHAISKDKAVVVNFELNCISHSFYRSINIHTINTTYSLNLISGEYAEYSFGEIKVKKKFNVDRDIRYQNLWKDLIEGYTLLPSYSESVKFLQEIE